MNTKRLPNMWVLPWKLEHLCYGWCFRNRICRGIQARRHSFSKYQECSPNQNIKNDQDQRWWKHDENMMRTCRKHDETCALRDHFHTIQLVQEQTGILLAVGVAVGSRCWESLKGWERSGPVGPRRSLLDDFERDSVVDTIGSQMLRDRETKIKR